MLKQLRPSSYGLLIQILFVQVCQIAACGPPTQPPVEFTLHADDVFPGFTGRERTAIQLTITLRGIQVPSLYEWTVTGGVLEDTETADPSNTLFVDWRNAGERIKVQVTGEREDSEFAPLSTVNVWVDDAAGPVVAGVTVEGYPAFNGDKVEPEFASYEELDVIAYATDPDGGELAFEWSLTGPGTLTPGEAGHAVLLTGGPGEESHVELVVSDNNGGEGAMFQCIICTYELEPSLKVYTTADLVEFTGSDYTHVPLFAELTNAEADSFIWSTSGGQLDKEVTHYGENTLYVGYLDAGGTVFVNVIADCQGNPVSGTSQFEVVPAQGPVVTQLIVNGEIVLEEDTSPINIPIGQDISACVYAYDPDLGGLHYTWQAGPEVIIEDHHDNPIVFHCEHIGVTTTIIVTIGDYNGGDPAVRSFDVHARLPIWSIDEMRLRSVPHIGPDSIRLLVETSETSEQRQGLMARIRFDDEKLRVTQWDAEFSEENPYSPGTEIFHVEGDTVYIETFGWEPAFESGPICYLDFTVTSGWGTHTDFTFVQNDSLYKLRDHQGWIPASIYTNAMGVPVPEQLP
jgi:hypothetical protein